MNTYATELREAITHYPTDYAYGLDKLNEVLERTKASLQKGMFSKDGRAFKATCKKLGIIHTYQDIKSFLGL